MYQDDAIVYLSINGRVDVSEMRSTKFKISLIKLYHSVNITINVENNDINDITKGTEPEDEARTRLQYTIYIYCTPLQPTNAQTPHNDASHVL